MRWFLFILVLVVTVGLVLAFNRGWIVVGTTKDAGNESTQVNIKVDRAKAREDLREAREQTKEIVEKTRERVTGVATLTGEIMAVDAAQSQVTVKAEGQEHAIRVDKDTTIERGADKVPLDTLKAGEHATIKVKETDGVKLAQSIVVGPKS